MFASGSEQSCIEYENKCDSALDVRAFSRQILDYLKQILIFESKLITKIVDVQTGSSRFVVCGCCLWTFSLLLLLLLL